MKRCPTCDSEWPDEFRLCPNDGATLQAATAPDDLAGTVLAGRYHVASKIGAGGMGTVWKAEHLRTRQPVAIKVMAPQLTVDPASVARFNREARNAARIRHPNVCIVHDFGETDTHLHYLVLEYLEGESLATVLTREGVLPPPRAASIVHQCCEALQAAHVLGIVHRDIKPDNIMTLAAQDGSDAVKIVDFGLAKETIAGNEQAVTEPGLLVGTPDYMSPEQISGNDLDGHSDQYSLALVLFRMVTGALPFEGTTPEKILIERMTEAPASLHDVRSDIEELGSLQSVLDRAFQRRPQDRFATIVEFGAAVVDAIAAKGSSATVSVDSHPGVVTSRPSLETARSAAKRLAWSEAVAAFRHADTEDELTAEDLESLGNAAWWTGDIDRSIAARERAVAAYLEQDDSVSAADVALKIAESFHLKLSTAVAAAWIKRAERLLDQHEDTTAYGYLVRIKSWMAFDKGDIDEAIARAEEVMRIAERFDDANLRALSLQDHGKGLIALGETKAGMAMIDEAMALAVAGEVSPMVTGKTYCNMLSACEKAVDYERATQWSDAATQWCETNTDSAFPGICRVFRAKIMRLRGAWRAAFEAARDASTGLEGFVEASAEAWYEIGEIRLRLGDLPGADEAFQRAHALGRTPVPGIAELRLAEGNLDHATALIDTALADAVSNGLRRLRLLPTKIEIALETNHLEGASIALAEFTSIGEDLDSPMLLATALELRGSIDDANGDGKAAIDTLRKAVQAWSDIGFPFDTARTRFKLSRACRSVGDDASADLEARAALVTFEQLGAQLWIGRARSILPA